MPGRSLPLTQENGLGPDGPSVYFEKFYDFLLTENVLETARGFFERTNRRKTLEVPGIVGNYQHLKLLL